MEKKKFLSTGAFARLCRTTKETLFHYDREHLLRPSFVNDKGYRWYDVRQFLEFDTISMLKETGSSLAEIREHMRGDDDAAFLRFLEGRRAKVDEEVRRMQRRRDLLEDMVACLEEVKASEPDTLAFVDEPESSYEYFAVPRPLDSLQDLIAGYMALLDHCSATGRGLRAPCGDVLTHAGRAGGDVRRDAWRRWCFFFRAGPDTPKDALLTRPAGRYARLVHRGDTASHDHALEAFLTAIAAAGRRVEGPVYMFDLMAYTFHEGRSEYFCRYSALTLPLENDKTHES